MDAFEELERAVRSNDIGKVSEVMTNCPDLRDPGFSWIINDAIRLGLTEITRVLLENGVLANSTSKNLCKPSPLMNACKLGNKNIVRLLLEHGAAVDGEDNFGVPPLVLAARSGNMEIFDLLLTWKANVDQRIDYEFVKWPFNSQRMNQAQLECMSAPYEQNTVLIEACRAQHFEIVQKLLLHGANLHAANQAKETPLHITACPRPWLSYQHYNKRILPTAPEILHCLLQHGADVNAHNMFGQTPLDRTLAEIEHILNCKILSENVTETLQKHFRNFYNMVQAGSNLKIYANPANGEEDLYGFLLDAYLQHQDSDSPNKACLQEFKKVLKAIDLALGKPREVFVRRFIMEIRESIEKRVIVAWLKSRQRNCRSLKELCGTRVRQVLHPPLMLNVFTEELELPLNLREYLIKS
ncbi:poly [ADP-ribose] polymerase tankyrase-2-like [Lineus longissimus]|uniref:poly [ADP-ribose] polymerase tankyrase-2-like n=1 Tax=Lineus longissimus TaxID=88925 RepID=UPI002B4D5D80